MSPLSESIASQIADLEAKAIRTATAEAAISGVIGALRESGLLQLPGDKDVGVAALNAERDTAVANLEEHRDLLAETRKELAALKAMQKRTESFDQKDYDAMAAEKKAAATQFAEMRDRAHDAEVKLSKMEKRIHELTTDIEAANESMGSLLATLNKADRLEKKETEKKGDGLAEHIDLVHHVVEGMLEDLGVAGDLDDGDPDDAPAAPRKKAKKGYAEIQIRMFIENLVRRGDGEATAKEKADSRRRLEGASFDGIDPQIVTMAARAITGDLKDAEWRKFDEAWEDAAIAKEKAADKRAAMEMMAPPTPPAGVFVIMRTVPKLGKQLFVNGEDRWVLATDADHATKWPTALDAEAVKKAMNLRRTKVIALAELGPAPIVELHADAGDEGGFVVTASLERGRRCFALVGPGMTGLTTYHKVLEDEVAVAEFEHLEEAKSRARELAKLLGYRTAVWDVGRLVKEEERTQEDGSLAEAVAE